MLIYMLYAGAFRDVTHGMQHIYKLNLYATN
jgi:hypothetical protein